MFGYCICPIDYQFTLSQDPPGGARFFNETKDTYAIQVYLGSPRQMAKDYQFIGTYTVYPEYSISTVPEALDRKTEHLLPKGYDYSTDRIILFRYRNLTTDCQYYKKIGEINIVENTVKVIDLIKHCVDRIYVPGESLS